MIHQARQPAQREAVAAQSHPALAAGRVPIGAEQRAQAGAVDERHRADVDHELVLVEPDFAFGALEAFFDGPAGAGDPGQLT